MQPQRFFYLRRSLRQFLLCSLLGTFLAVGFPFVSAIGQTTPAQLLMTQGQQDFERGNFELALERWKQAETLLRQNHAEDRILGIRLNQAKAWQSLGFYRRAKDLLEQLRSATQTQPASKLKAQVLLEYGNILRLMGHTNEAQRVLAESLTIANQLQAEDLIQAAHLYLGNTLLAQQQQPEALKHFQTAAQFPGTLRLSAQLHQFRWLQHQKRTPEAIDLLPEIESSLAGLPTNPLSIYGRIELAALLPTSEALKAAQLLTRAIQQAQTLGNLRAESYAVGRLGAVYERTGQLLPAKQLTERALQLARRAEVPEILYQWEWQLGRILKTQGDLQTATDYYTKAVNRLRSLRKDLVGLGQDVQFSFRDQVEPVYRELVDLLLQPNATQDNLKQARQVVESLQLAELNNFFREACLDLEARPIENIDPTAAIIYPIILSDRLEVILSIPGQPLRHAVTPVPRKDIEAGIEKMIIALRPTAFPQEQLTATGQLYQWIIQPIAADLAQHPLKTLVFVLDGPLRGVPMASLHDGNQYLVEHYQIAITPSLQLVSPRHANPTAMRALVAGLAEGTMDSTPLPGVKQEVETIRQKISAQVLMDRSFTSQTLRAEMSRAPFTLVHLATHGQFGASAEETYIKTWNGQLTANELKTLLNQRSLIDKSAIELLVLSACQTAVGDNRAALGMAGLAVRSGARSTLATLWSVSDTSTTVLVEKFYTQLLQPQTSKAQALQEAQLSLLRSQKFNNPFYWAPFILVGNWL